ncbi:MAG: hypothetical protein COT81_03775 [Candidatus Buchananbacteria bacterium CG10_big_fil_rev_8_21_14_0_10_42_9]|uniref:Type II secretion system protein GspG C-terminal domain-containing protein n=1 Tax=Candidatus Buchananbacteria bacterium CG10_big_fil_rev_8_21_14_0_10_42_9 TaxID=1974526 RepID=A0A2H0W0Q9_9BACT|nr:MAG: hypothetical protein COT81_03775 [Candidatus Buchananbacteria bacterium CG10_big_fil_rev_8_21_14_0_10_42_9]
MKKLTTNKKGFTLVELLVVIAIIGLLSTIAIVALNSAREKARDAKRVADVKQIQTALELLFNDTQAYPAEAVDGTPDPLGISGSTDTLSETNGFADTAAGEVYMGSVPRDPSETGAASACTGASTATCDYAYEQLTATTYNIEAYLEGTVGNLGASSGSLICATQDGIANGACP